MSQPSLEWTPQAPPLGELLKGENACARLARLFLSRRGQWIDGKVIATVAGTYAWRTRCSNLRKAPWFLDIRNRQRHIRTECAMCEGDGFAPVNGEGRMNCQRCHGCGRATYTISEYALMGVTHD